MESEALIGRGHEAKGSRTFNAPESGKITLNWREFTPKTPLEEEPGQKTGIFFHPGWAGPEWGSEAKKFCQEAADFNGVPVYVLEIRGDPRRLKQRDGAELERQFIEEQGFTNVKMVGVSEGGMRAAHLVDLLQDKNPKIHINGLIVMSSKGLGDHNRPNGQVEGQKDIVPSNFLDWLFYKPDAKDLTEPHREDESNFFGRFLGDAGANILFHPFKNRKIYLQALRVQGALIADLAEQIIEAGGNVKAGIKNLRGEMVSRNPVLSRIKCPVVLIHGEADLMTKPEFFIKPDMTLESASEFARGNLQLPFDERSRNKIVELREKFVHDILFKKSSAIKILFAAEEKHGNHALAVYRRDQVIRTAFAALERLNRRELEIKDREEFREYLKKGQRRFTQSPPVKKAA